MAKVWTRTEAFRFFGATLTNTRWSWSARTPDGATVVLALWTDRFDRQVNPIQYNDHRISPDDSWIRRPGNRERLENLLWARDNCRGKFRVVLVRPKNSISDPREIDECWLKEDLVMRLMDLNEQTGEFTSVATVL